MTRKECYLVLNHVSSIGSVRGRKLVETFRSVEALFGKSAQTLAQVPGISLKTAEHLLDWKKDFDLSEELEKLHQMGASYVDIEDESYPSRLKAIYDPPLVLYYKGNLAAASKRSLAIVGSRHTSAYGFEAARKLSYQAAYTGLSVVSGLARGIDTAAHQGALAAKGTTVGVLGSSIDLIYPSENQVLAEKMIESGGAILSEFALGTPPAQYTFPLRNRVVSGLSEGVLVIEAGERSGALITSRLALEQGRQVFAVPGRIDVPYSKGCHRLIQEGAKLVGSIEDVLAEFELLFPKSEVNAVRPTPENIGVEEKTILDALENEETPLDVIIRKSGLPPAQVSSYLLKLELKRLVKQLPGKFFVKTY